MKIKLSVNDIPDKDYVTIDPAPISGPAFTGNIITLEGVCDRAEATEILGDKILDYIPVAKIEVAIDGWCSLLRHGAKIILGGTNANHVSRTWVTKEISLEALNNCVYGNGAVRKAGIYSIEHIEQLLKKNGIKIVRKSLPGQHFVIEGIRE